MYLFSSQVSHLPLGSIGLPHLPLNPSQLKAPDGAIEKIVFICFFVAYQVNDLQPESV